MNISSTIQTEGFNIVVQITRNSLKIRNLYLVQPNNTTPMRMRLQSELTEFSNTNLA